MTMTTRELAIARSVVYASLFDYPLTLEQLHRTLVESEQTAAEILAVYDGSEILQRIIEFRDGFFFPAGRSGLIAERARRESRSREFLRRHERLLRLICALPYTRLVALSGSIAHMNLEPDGDLDLFVITKGPRVWTVTVALLLLAKLLRRRRVVCANFVLADSHLTIDEQDLFSANQAIHLRPLVGAPTLARFLAANPFVARIYPNASAETTPPVPVDVGGRGLAAMKAALEIALTVPAPLVERVCRRLYAWHLGRRAASWRSPGEVRLRSTYLKLHTQSHRRSVLDRFDAAMDAAWQSAVRPIVPRAAAGGRR